MQPHVQTKASSHLLTTLGEVKRYFDDIPDSVIGPDGEIKITCHNVVQAIAHAIPTLKPVHGYFESACEHAWLQTDDPDWIIDPYPPFMLGGPVLVYLSTANFSPWCRIYDRERRPTALDKLGLLDEVNAIIGAVERKRMFLGMP